MFSTTKIALKFTDFKLWVLPMSLSILLVLYVIIDIRGYFEITFAVLLFGLAVTYMANIIYGKNVVVFTVSVIYDLRYGMSNHQVEVDSLDYNKIKNNAFKYYGLMGIKDRKTEEFTLDDISFSNLRRHYMKSQNLFSFEVEECQHSLKSDQKYDKSSYSYGYIESLGLFLNAYYKRSEECLEKASSDELLRAIEKRGIPLL